MSGAAELRGKGVELTAEGEQLHLRAPAGTLTDEVKAQLRDHKPEVLALLRDAVDGLAETSIVLETRAVLVAVRVRSRSLRREVWLARDERTARELHQSAPAGESLPVLLFEEIPKLRGNSPEMLNALLDTKALFPTAKILE